MHYSTFFVLATATRAMAQASPVGNYSSSLDMADDFNVGLVDIGVRTGWCNAQYDTCEALCDNDTDENDCIPETLKWDCTCFSNSSTPGLQFYSQTVPTLMCLDFYGKCKETNAGDQDAQRACDSNIKAKCIENDPPTVSGGSDDDDEDDENTTTVQSSSSTATGDNSEATGDDVTTTDTEDIAAPTMMPGNVAAVAAIGVLAYML